MVIALGSSSPSVMFIKICILVGCIGMARCKQLPLKSTRPEKISLHCASHNIHFCAKTMEICTLRNIVYTTQSTQHSLHNIVYTKQFSQHSLHNIVYTTYFTQHSLNNIVHTTQSTQYNLHNIIYTTQLTQHIEKLSMHPGIDMNQNIHLCSVLKRSRFKCSKGQGSNA